MGAPKSDVLKKSLQDDFNKLLDQKLQELRKEMQGFINKENKNLLAQLNKKEQEIKSLKDDNLSLTKKVQHLEDRLDSIETTRLRETVVISGRDVPAATPQEDNVTTVIKLLQDKAQLSVEKDEITQAIRTGKKSEGQQRPTEHLEVTFKNREAKLNVIRCIRRVQPNIYVNEKLTPTRSTILYALRKAKKMKPEKIAAVTSMDGKPCIYFKNSSDEQNQRIFLTTPEKLQSFCNSTLDINMDTLVNNWP